jgi:hypothetical protein
LASQDPPPAMPNGKPYANKDADWIEMQAGSKNARYLDLVDPTLFVERRSPEAHVYATHRATPEPGAVFDEGRWYATGFDYDPADQPVTCEVLIEKSTMHDILDPLCRELGINLVTGVGFSSITREIELLTQRTQKPTRLFYVSDYDKAGHHMPVAVARQIQFWRTKYAPQWDVKLTPLVLTPAQIAHFRLPANANGDVELDALEALHPGELEHIVRAAVAPYVDPLLRRRLVQAREKAEEQIEAKWQAVAGDALQHRNDIRQHLDGIDEDFQRRIDELIAPLKAKWEEARAPHAADLEAARQAISELVDAFDPGLPERPKPEIALPDESDWLFDGARSYLEQAVRYHQHKQVER